MKKTKRKKRQKLSNIQITVLAMIGVCFAVVIFYLIFSLINRPENRVPRTITQMAEDYYENYLYEDISKSQNFIDNPSKAMESYEKYGFTAVDLKTLLLFDNQKNAKFADELRKYCNAESTFVKFYPHSPYNKKDYEANYTYSCEF